MTGGLAERDEGVDMPRGAAQWGQRGRPRGEASGETYLTTPQASGSSTEDRNVCRSFQLCDAGALLGGRRAGL